MFDPKVTPTLTSGQIRAALKLKLRDSLEDF